ILYKHFFCSLLRRGLQHPTRQVMICPPHQFVVNKISITPWVSQLISSFSQLLRKLLPKIWMKGVPDNIQPFRHTLNTRRTEFNPVTIGHTVFMIYLLSRSSREGIHTPASEPFEHHITIGYAPILTIFYPYIRSRKI